jgi:hypothetical protein
MCHLSVALSYKLLENLICFSLIIFYRNVLFASDHIYHVFCLLTLYFFHNIKNMAIEVEKKKDEVVFLDPECFSKIMLITSHSFCVSCMKRTYQLYAEKRVIISAYNIVGC